MVVAIGLATTFAHSLNINYIIIENVKNLFRIALKSKERKSQLCPLHIG